MIFATVAGVKVVPLIRTVVGFRVSASKGRLISFRSNLLLLIVV